jgi:hypothetical protein
MRGVGGVFLVLAALLLAAAGRAEERTTATLSYAADPECPTESSFHDLVAARLGYDPFGPSGSDRVAVRIAKQGDKLVGRAEVAHGHAEARTRELAATGDRCEPLATALATTVAIALDPLRAGGPPPAAPPPALAAPSTVVFVSEKDAPPASPGAPAPAERPAPAQPPRLSLFGAAGAVATAGVAPGPALGPEFAFAVRAGAISCEVSARAEIAMGDVRADSGDRLEATLLTGALAPCAHLRQFAGCIFGRIGSFQGRAPDVAQPSLGTSVFAALGLRGAYALPLGGHFAVRGALEAGLPLVRTTLFIDRAPVWTAPAAFAGASLAALVQFL